MAEAKKKAVKAVTPKEIKFPKSKLLTFRKYYDRIDLLTALLDDTKEYSVDEVDTIVDNFLKGKVK